MVEIQKKLEEKTERQRFVAKHKSQAEQGIAEADKQLAIASEAAESTAKQLSEARTRVEEIKAALSSSKSQGSVLQALMEQKKKGKIPGIYDRLGNLGTIDGKYDVAISTACGALDNIVVAGI